MKLYFSPFSCSLASHITLRELDLPFELERVNTKTKQTETGRSYWDINPKGYVAALAIDEQTILTEAPAILQYLADQKPEAGLAPANGTLARARLQEWLNYIGTELHCTAGPLFNRSLGEAALTFFTQKLQKRLAFVDQALANQAYLMGAKFSVADAYLYTVLGWLKFFDIDVEQWTALAAFRARVEQRPAVQAALQVEKEYPEC